MKIEKVIDTLYPTTTRVSMNDITFSNDMDDARGKLNKEIWVNGQHISELAFDELMIIYIILIENTTLFFRDEWRILIRKKLYNSFKISSYEVSEKIISAGSLF